MFDEKIVVKIVAIDAKHTGSSKLQQVRKTMA
jgi:hypothetical protein